MRNPFKRYVEADRLAREEELAQLRKASGEVLGLAKKLEKTAENLRTKIERLRVEPPE